ncbi:uncharacterized protein LOC123938586 isoform X2 [Meles meles]|uniref:uncharacterized protein LOC123938586 isoform X2 n=1 Tax=Meles meles TaxID=9662 RepID=UPI001E698D9D|nr:uncharacterized protein LOC123938586 isoform X2 [Meles meles]
MGRGLGKAGSVMAGRARQRLRPKVQASGRGTASGTQLPHVLSHAALSGCASPLHGQQPQPCPQGQPRGSKLASPQVTPATWASCPRPARPAARALRWGLPWPPQPRGGGCGGRSVHSRWRLKLLGSPCLSDPRPHPLLPGITVPSGGSLHSGTFHLKEGDPSSGEHPRPPTRLGQGVQEDLLPKWLCRAARLGPNFAETLWRPGRRLGGLQVAGRCARVQLTGGRRREEAPCSEHRCSLRSASVARYGSDFFGLKNCQQEATFANVLCLLTTSHGAGPRHSAWRAPVRPHCAECLFHGVDPVLTPGSGQRSDRRGARGLRSEASASGHGPGEGPPTLAHAGLKPPCPGSPTGHSPASVNGEPANPLWCVGTGASLGDRKQGAEERAPEPPSGARPGRGRVQSLVAPSHQAACSRTDIFCLFLTAPEPHLSPGTPGPPIVSPAWAAGGPPHSLIHGRTDDGRMAEWRDGGCIHG